jgi:hypothetical protein
MKKIRYHSIYRHFIEDISSENEIAIKADEYDCRNTSELDFEDGD